MKTRMMIYSGKHSLQIIYCFEIGNYLIREFLVEIENHFNFTALLLLSAKKTTQ